MKHFITSILFTLIISSNVFANNISDSNRIFNWIEVSFPDYFTPARQQTFEMEGYFIRYYPTTNNYVATQKNQVYVYGDVFGGLKDVGSISYYIDILDNDMTLDTDGDEVPDYIEKKLRTNIYYYDSDCDSIRDDKEIGNDYQHPIDSDNDGIIDALESSIADNNNNGISDSLDPDITDIQITCPRFSPFAVMSDGYDSTRFEILIFGNSIDRVSIDLHESYELFDDGTHGDLVAQDNIFTIDGITCYSTYSGGGYGISIENIKISNFGIPNVITFNDRNVPKSRLNLIPESQDTTVIQVNANLFIASNFINIVNSEMSLSVRRDGQSPEAIKLFYSYFKDDFDFLNIRRDFKVVPSNLSGSALRIQNNVKGIGSSIFDNSLNYGSNGNLKCIIMDAAYLHEIMHTWGVFFDSYGFGKGFDGDNIGYHTGVVGAGKGFLGGFDAETLQNNNDGTYTVLYFQPNANFMTYDSDTNSHSIIDYSMFELYLMGLASASEVPDFSLPVNPNNPVYDSASNIVTFLADSIMYQSIDDIINSEGKRIPTVANSQKLFTFASVIFSHEPLTETEMAYFNFQTKELGSTTDRSFQKATKNRGKMRTNIDESMLLTSEE